MRWSWSAWCRSCSRPRGRYLRWARAPPDGHLEITADPNRRHLDVTPPCDDVFMAVIGGSDGVGAMVVADRDLDAVAAALAAIGARGSAESPAALRHRLQVLEGVVRMAEAAVVAVVAECDRTHAFRDDGHVSVRNWVAAETNTAGGEALARMRVARLSDACPQAVDALASGRVGIAQIREIARVRANPRVTGAVDDMIDELLTEAAATPLHAFIAMIRRLEALLDADGSHRDHDAAHAGRRLRMWSRPDQPIGELFGQFGAADYAEIAEILERYTDAETDHDLAQARLSGDHTPLARTPDQRRADALLQALRDAAAANTPSHGGVPVVNYVVTQSLIDEHITAMVQARTPNLDRLSPRDQWCLTASGIPVDPTVVVAAMLIGHVRRIVLDATGRIIDVGRKRRLFTGAARDAATLQALIDNGDGRCLWPGCGRRRRLQIDHTLEHQHGGTTDAHNADPLCGPHNRHKSHHHTITRDPTGHWHTHRPDGTRIGACA